MAMKIWTLTVKWNGLKTEHQFKCAEADARHLDTSIHTIINIRGYCRPLEGWKDEPGELMNGWMTTIGGGETHPVADPEQWQKDVQALIARLPYPGEIGNGQLAKDLHAEAERLFDVHIPIVDRRKDRQVEADKNAQYQAAKVEQEAAAAARQALFAEAWAENNTPLTIPEGMQAIYLSLNYDNSDHMSDYYAPHSTVPGSTGLLLQWTDARTAQTEKLAREALAHFPWIAALQDTRWVEGERQPDGRIPREFVTGPIRWDWKTEKYSMGHGNYLESGKVLDITLNEGSKFEKTVGVTLEVEFTTYKGQTLLPIRRL